MTSETVLLTLAGLAVIIGAVIVVLVNATHVPEWAPLFPAGAPLLP